MPDVAERIMFLPRQSHQEFVSLLECCDVMLDPYHFGGGATTYEALAVGTPIVTLPATFMRGRVTAACYRKMGVMDCVAATKDDYVDRAVKLGTEPDYRNVIRSTILSTNDALYEDVGAVAELQEFFLETSHSARSGSAGPHADNRAAR